jgi:phosphoglycolate phosphatase-like HAD superfamily hydrolase
MDVKSVIFDFDGTIANSFAATLRIANALAPTFGYRPAAPEEVEVLRGWSYRQVAAELGVPWHKIPLIAARIRKELSTSVAQLETFDGLPNVLTELRARGFGLGILTSNSKANVERFLAAHELKQFEFVSTSASVWGKKRRLEALLRSHRLAAHEVAYVGDEVRDIEATKPLAIRMVAVGWGYARRETLAAHGPDHLISYPVELLEIFARKSEAAAAIPVSG